MTMISKEKIKTVCNRLTESKFGRMCDKLCNSPYYSAAIGVAVFLSHTFGIPTVGAALLTLLLVPALLFCDNSFALIPFLLMCSFVLSEDTKPDTGHFNSPGIIAVLCILAVVLAASLAFNIIYYKKWKDMFKRKYLTVSLAILTVGLVLGGAASGNYSFGTFGMALCVGITMLIPYSMLVNCGKYKGRETVVYFAWALIVAGLVIGADVFVQYARFGFDMGGTTKAKLKLGFVGPNTGAAIITLAVVMTFYLVYIYERGYLFVPLIGLEIVAVLATISRASLLVLLPGTVIVATALCFKKKNGKIGYWIAYGISAAIALAAVIYFRKTLFGEIANWFSGSNTGSGRTKLWKIGFTGWKKEPAFGLGLLYLQSVGHWYYSFHCTPLTYLFCTGVIGFVAYIYHRYKSVRLVFSAKLTTERVFLALTALAMICNALLDIAMTSPTHLIYYAAMLALTECDVKAVKDSHSDKAVEIDRSAENDGQTGPDDNNSGVLEEVEQI